MLIKIAILLMIFEQSLPQVAGQCCSGQNVQSPLSSFFPFFPDYSWLLPQPSFSGVIHPDKKESGGC
ncbi:hypothetical protein QQG55_20165 [Brugia pahangi]|uniref:Secreted protein n=1 Tax=Brugia pahangi TaxID=6280 RepID=A0A0N4TZZ2_BRUPA|nr:unnamed protein product [Brugia pahangi]